MSNASLDDFAGGGEDTGGDGDEEERPTAEAAAVAGDGGGDVDFVDTADYRFPDADGTVELAVTQVDYTIEGRGENQRPILHVFGRDADREVEHVRVHGFKPYFYAPLANFDGVEDPAEPVTAEEITDSRLEGGLTGVETYADRRADGAAVPDERDDDEVVVYESIRGRPLAKVFGRTPPDVGQRRDEFEHYEADILFPNRLLIDKDVRSGVAVPDRRADDGAVDVPHQELQPVEMDVEPRVNTFDIEVDDRSGFPEDGEETIVCLTTHDSYRDEYIVWLYEPPGDAAVPGSLADHDHLDPEVTHQVRTFEREEEMLAEFVDYVEEDTDPDVITGWNCLPADAAVQMADGTERAIEDVAVGDRVVGSEDQQSTTATVTNKWRSEKPIHEFELADGTTLRSSGDHRIMVGDDDAVDWKRGRNVEPGDYVLKPRKLRIPDETVPTLRDLVPIEKQRFPDGEVIKSFKSDLPEGAITQLADEFDLTTGTLHHPEPSTWTPERCAYAAERYDVARPDGGRVYPRTGVDLDRELTEHELYLAGLVLTDGTMSMDGGIRFYDTRRELHEQFPGENELTPDGKGSYKQNVLDYTLLYAFNGLGIPFGDENATDVDLSTVFEMPEPYVERFLAGVIDGNGHVGDTVSVAARNRAIGEWYVKLFKRLGVYASRHGDIVRVSSAARDIEPLKDRVLPHMNHPEKADRLAGLDGGTSGQTENIPYALFDAPTGSDEKRIGNDKHRRGLNLKRHETSSNEWEEHVFVRVESTTLTGSEVTYDIETTTHDFVTEECLVHNCDDFDAPYLLDRLEELGGTGDLDPDRLSRVDEVWRSDWQGPNVKGRVVFDLYYAYERTQFTELESYRLDDVGEEELGVGKERYPGDIGDLWEEDPERLLEYNLRDVELCVELDRKQEIVAFWNDARKIVGCKLEDATTPGDAVDMYVLHKAHGRFALPSKGQQETEEFEGGAVFDPITGVREMVSVLDLKCFSGDTDVLTPDGVRNVRELDVGDDVYTLNPETFECEVNPVTETHAYENRFGELHHLSGNTHDLKVTENHRFLVSKERGWDDQTPADFTFREYREIPDAERFAFPQHEPMAGRSPETFDLIEEVDGGQVVVYCEDDLRAFRNRMPDAVVDELDIARGSSSTMGLQQKVGKYLLPVEVYRDEREAVDEFAGRVYLKYDRKHCETPLSFEMDDWLRLLGWYVTEGSADGENGRITLHQSDEAGRGAIRSLLDGMDLDYSTDRRGINVSNRYLYEWLTEHCGSGYAEKRLPEWVFDLDADLLEPLLETMVDGDGSRTDSGLRKFWTKSDPLKDAFVDIAVRCGHKPTVSKQSDGTWYVSAGKRGAFEKRTNATVEEHDDQVYCVTAADNHVVLAGRNGNFQWVGQSLYPMSMVTINASPETLVDPDEYDGDTYRTPNGVHFRKDRDGIIREMVDELLDEREELKNRRDATDPGSEDYERYDRQQSAVKVIMNCFTPDTDVLTPEGVRNIRDLAVGDEVYSLDPETETMEVKPVVETHAYPDYRGELVDVETSRIDFRVTPNHRMLVRKNEKNGVTWDGYRFVEAGDLDDATNYELPHDWAGPGGDRIDEIDLTEHLDEYEIWADHEVHGHTLVAEIGFRPELRHKDGETGYVFDADSFEEHREYLESVCSAFYVHAEHNHKWIPRSYDGDDFLELLAWYVTEGSVYTSEERRFGDTLRGPSTTVKIAQEANERPASTDGAAVGADPVSTDGGDHAAIGALLDRMGLDYYEDSRCYQFTSKLLGEFLERVAGENSSEKRIPEFVFGASCDQKRLFLETLVAGDGDRQVDSWRYSTASERLRDDVLRLCAHLGLTATYSRDSDVWRVYVAENGKNTLGMHRSASRSTAENGVYCVTVADNNTLLAGRNGRFQFVGQSLYGVFGWDRFRLYDREMSAAITATNREVISYTEDVANEMDYQITYGDSVTGDRPVVVRDPEGRVRLRPIAELFEAADVRPDSGLVVTADGGPVGTVTTAKERGSLDGWEALSVNPDGDAEWQPIEEIVRHETDEPVVNLRHEFGESTTTRDHSYVVDDGDGFVEAVPEDVSEPLRVPGLPEVDAVDRIDVYDVLRGYTRQYEDGRSRGSEAAETKVEGVHANEEYVWFGHEHHDTLDSTVKVRRYIERGTEAFDGLVRLLAAYVTEGSATTEETASSTFGASIAESRREWLDGIQTDYHRLFENVETSIVESDTRGRRTVEHETDEGDSSVTHATLKLQMMNELSAVFFREFAGGTSRGKRIPSFVFHLPEREQRLFLEALVEGDGPRAFPRDSKEYTERHFGFETVSRKLAAGLSMLLTQRGRKHSLTFRDGKDSYTVRTCDHYRDGRDPVLDEVIHDGYVYDLSVAENDNFVDAVGGIVLHNTDSVMLELGTDLSKSEAVDRSFELARRINQSYDEFARERLNAADHRFEIEFEKLYRRFFQAGKKKRYAGHIIWKEGKDVDDVDIVGFEYQRSDIAPITKEVQLEVLERIIRSEDEDYREDVKEYVHDVIESFENGEMSVEDVGIPGGIGKRLDNYDTDTAQVRGAKYANLLLGTNFGRGSKPKRLYLKRVHNDFYERVERERGLDIQEDPLYREFRENEDVICVEYADQLPEEFEVDWEKMLDRTLRGPIERVLSAIDVSWDEVRTGQEQTGLGSFV